MFMRGLKALAEMAGSYGRNVVGGAKIVGGAVKKGIQKMGTNMENEIKAGEKKWKDLEEKNRKEKTGEY